MNSASLTTRTISKTPIKASKVKLDRNESKVNCSSAFCKGDDPHLVFLPNSDGGDDDDDDCNGCCCSCYCCCGGNDLWETMCTWCNLRCQTLRLDRVTPAKMAKTRAYGCGVFFRECTSARAAPMVKIRIERTSMVIKLRSEGSSNRVQTNVSKGSSNLMI